MDNQPDVISSIIVQVRPTKMSAIIERLKNFPTTEISATSPNGKIVIVMEADSDRVLANNMDDITTIEGVLGVNLVFHHSENAR